MALLSKIGIFRSITVSKQVVMKPLLLQQPNVRKYWITVRLKKSVRGQAKLYGRITSSVLLRSSSVLQLASISALFSLLIMKASLHPVKTPLLILISQSLSGVPYFSILDLILCSIGERITQEFESKVFSIHCSVGITICLLLPCSTWAKLGCV